MKMHEEVEMGWGWAMTGISGPVRGLGLAVGPQPLVSVLLID